MSFFEHISGGASTASKSLVRLRKRLPLQLQIAIACLILVMICIGLYTTLTARDSILHLRVQHSFRSAQIAVFVDEDRVYLGRLTGVAKKKYGLFGETAQGSLSQEIPLKSGSHRVRVEVTSSEGESQQESIAGDFPKNGQRTIVVGARRGDVSLSWQAAAAAQVTSANVAETSANSWLSRYAGTLILTIAGSIVSALTGFALKEIPAYVKSRQ